MNRPERASEPHYPTSAEIAAMREAMWRAWSARAHTIHPTHAPTWSHERRLGLPDIWTHRTR